MTWTSVRFSRARTLSQYLSNLMELTDEELQLSSMRMFQVVIELCLI